MRKRKTGGICARDEDCTSGKCIGRRCASEVLLDSGDEGGTKITQMVADNLTMVSKEQLKKTSKKHRRAKKESDAGQFRSEGDPRPASKTNTRSSMKDGMKQITKQASSDEPWVMPASIFFPVLAVVIIIGLLLIWWCFRLILRVFRPRKKIVRDMREGTATVLHPVVTVDAPVEETIKKTTFESIPVKEVYAPAPKQTWPGLMPSMAPAPINLAATPEPLLDHIPKTPLEQREFASPVNMSAPVRVEPSQVVYPSSEEMDTQRAWQ